MRHDHGKMCATLIEMSRIVLKTCKFYPQKRQKVAYTSKHASDHVRKVDSTDSGHRKVNGAETHCPDGSRMGIEMGLDTCYVTVENSMYEGGPRKYSKFKILHLKL